ncbi:MAG: hypothetical protein WAT23_03755 [Chromatiaceae bacterium]
MRLITMSESGSVLGRVASLSLGFLLFCGPLASHGAAETLEIKTVISDGLGTDVPSAAQNAAQNALTNVVGSFIDASKMLEKRVEIQEGVRSQTSRIDTNIKEYSQGSIQGFEVLEVSKQAGLTKVTAKVSVRLEDFQNYIKKLAEGKAAVAGESLFAQAATQTKQSDNQVALLLDNVIAPIVSGEVTRFKIGELRPLSQVDLDDYSENRFSMIKSHEVINDMSTKYGKENIFAIRMTATLDPDFAANMKKTLASIGQRKAYRSTVGELSMIYTCEDASQILYGDRRAGCVHSSENDDVVLLINNGSAELDTKDESAIGNDKIPSDLYLFADAKKKLMQSSPLANSLYLGTGVTMGDFPVQDLQIALLDKDEEVLQEETIEAHPPNVNRLSPRAIARSTGVTALVRHVHYGQVSFSTIPWLMLKNNRGNYGVLPLIIFEQREFDIILAIKPEALAKATSIRVNLVN